MTLKGVRSGRIKQPERMVLYGPPGIGKTTFAASAPKPLFLGSERGTAALDVDRLPQPSTWDDITGALHDVLTEDHSYQTIVIDTVDWCEPLCHAKVAQDAGVKAIEDIPYGRGYYAAMDLWRAALRDLDAITDRGINVILIAHSHIRTFKDPERDAYDRYELKIHARAAALICEWADELLFANYEIVAKDKDSHRVGLATGARHIHTTRSAAFDAKNRHGLPETLPLSWADYAAAKDAAWNRATDVPAIDDLVAQLPAERQEKARQYLEAAVGNAARYARAVAKVQQQIKGD